MAHSEELELAPRLQELRRDLLAIALLDPASSAELERMASEIEARVRRIDAVVDGSELSPEECRTRFEAFRARVALWHRANDAGVSSTDVHLPAQSLEPGVAAAELAGSLPLHWRAVERVLQGTWVGGPNGGAGGQASRVLPPELAERVRSIRGELDAIVKRFVTSNQGLVHNVVQRYRGLGLSHEDLMQDGNIGLLRAIERFDPRRGIPFASYAAWWVREAVRRALAVQARLIRLPVSALARRYALARTSSRLAHELGRAPSEQELAAATGLAPESSANIMLVSKAPLSLDAPKSTDSDVTLGDAIADTSALGPNEHTSANERGEHLQALLADLTPRERYVLHMRFGLSGNDEHTLEEIGTSLKLTRERVRQIVSAALGKLNRASKARELDL
jgi:RNA polymerase sigma factor (sigma-70 family)